MEVLTVLKHDILKEIWQMSLSLIWFDVFGWDMPAISGRTICYS
jgi:hypothetical protein